MDNSILTKADFEITERVFQATPRHWPIDRKLPLWWRGVALPERDEETAPSFITYKPDQLPVFTDKGIWMRLIAGNAYGLKNDVHTHSPCFTCMWFYRKAPFSVFPKSTKSAGFTW